MVLTKITVEIENEARKEFRADIPHEIKMKRLYVMRHAKSSWDDASLADYDRPLNERGLRRPPMMGRLIERGVIFQTLSFRRRPSGRKRRQSSGRGG